MSKSDARPLPFSRSPSLSGRSAMAAEARHAAARGGLRSGNARQQEGEGEPVRGQLYTSDPGFHATSHKKPSGSEKYPEYPPHSARRAGFTIVPPLRRHVPEGIDLRFGSDVVGQGEPSESGALGWDVRVCGEVISRERESHVLPNSKNATPGGSPSEAGRAPPCRSNSNARDRRPRGSRSSISGPWGASSSRRPVPWLGCVVSACRGGVIRRLCPPQLRPGGPGHRGRPVPPGRRRDCGPAPRAARQVRRLSKDLRQSCLLLLLARQPTDDRRVDGDMDLGRGRVAVTVHGRER